MKNTRLKIIAITLVLLVYAGCSKQNDHTAPTPPANINDVVQDNSGKTVKYWYDPMTPGQKFDKPGKSPFMDMQLIPKYAESKYAESNSGNESNSEGNGVTISSQTVQNLGIRLKKVEIKSFGESLSAVGRITPDERRFYAVQTRIPGFVERLSVRAVGDPVSKGQKIAEIYAPEILAAQQEYLTLLTLNQIDADNSLKQAARNRLKLLGMSDGEIDAINKTGKPSPRFGVYSPASGVLTELGIREGAQLMPGTSLMQISDLSQVWLIAEVPERDAARLKHGLTAEVQLQSLPGELFKGKVSYLYPMLNETSRTLQVRIELANKNHLLRPGMYANVSFAGQTHEALSVPTESIIATGKRKIVIVKNSVGYMPVEVETGQERDSSTEILKGLVKGEDVVASGQFLIDSEASLSGVLARLSKQDKPIEKNPTKNTAKQTSENIPAGHGKVMAIDIKTGNITLAHESIDVLGWPAMTMEFKVNEVKQLSQLKVGDNVEFDLKADAEQQYSIEHIKKSIPIKSSMKGENP